ncbi:unnamed protein product [Trypanosoma congolense IL3000]|uniref:WGS project CAEQ00000000 data, annotated contig 579 n=1 Tax=Trypanosoma congolense (strain IL3000) TaxID=1068625 RepID=F9WH07_TRYCI|nr:unnamed protein product [Trypanosoma congolense IL3000]
MPKGETVSTPCSPQNTDDRSTRDSCGERAGAASNVVNFPFPPDVGGRFTPLLNDLHQQLTALDSLLQMYGEVSPAFTNCSDLTDRDDSDGSRSSSSYADSWDTGQMSHNVDDAKQKEEGSGVDWDEVLSSQLLAAGRCEDVGAVCNNSRSSAAANSEELKENRPHHVGKSARSCASARVSGKPLIRCKGDLILDACGWGTVLNSPPVSCDAAGRDTSVSKWECLPSHDDVSDHWASSDDRTSLSSPMEQTSSACGSSGEKTHLSDSPPFRGMASVPDRKVLPAIIRQNLPMFMRQCVGSLFKFHDDIAKHVKEVQRQLDSHHRRSCDYVSSRDFSAKQSKLNEAFINLNSLTDRLKTTKHLIRQEKRSLSDILELTEKPPRSLSTGEIITGTDSDTGSSLYSPLQSLRSDESLSLQSPNSCICRTVPALRDSYLLVTELLYNRWWLKRLFAIFNNCPEALQQWELHLQEVGKTCYSVLENIYDNYVKEKKKIFRDSRVDKKCKKQVSRKPSTAA